MVYDIVSFTALGIGFILVATFFYFFIAIVQKIRTARKKGVEIGPFIGLALMFLFLTLVRLAFSYHELYLTEYGFEDINSYKLAIFFGYCMFICFVFFTEKILKKTKYVLTISNIACCIYGIIFINTTETLRTYAYLTIPILGLILIVNYSVILIVKTKGIIRRKMGIALIVFIFFAVFYAIDTTFSKTLLPFSEEITSVFARSGELVSIILLGLIYTSFDTFTEFDWSKKLKDLFLIDNKGNNLYHFSFSKRESLIDPNWISAGLSGIKDLMAEIIKSEDRLKTLDHQDLKLIFEYGKHIIMVLIISENLRIYHSKLAILMEQFEEFFQNILPHWSGDTNVFLPTKQIINQVFELEAEGKDAQIEKINIHVKKFLLFSILLFLFLLANCYVLYFLISSSWQSIWSENMGMFVIIAPGIFLAVLAPIWWKYKIYQKMQSLKTNMGAVPRKISFPSILCVINSALGLLIYLFFGSLAWATLFCVISGLELFLLFLLGLNFIMKLETTKN